jgi:pyruvate formate lyase activating enzyme
MNILKKLLTPHLIYYILVILIIVIVYVWQYGFKNLLNKSNQSTIFLVRGEKEQEAVSSATPKIQEKEAMFYIKLDEDNKVWCQLCFRKCIIPNGQRGFCRNRENRDGTLYSLVYAQPCAVHIDPIEKEPQLHMLPGSDILCLATVSCNFRCKQCHNWHISHRGPGEVRTYYLPPEQVVLLALENQTPTISFTYTEPTVFYEYMYDIAKIAKTKGVRILFHSNGGMAEEPLKELLKFTDAVTIDLKGFSEDVYRKTYSSELAPVLRTLKIIKEEGIWLEIVNLVIPTVNDNFDDIKRMCIWINENLGEDVPLHFSRFSPAHKLTHLPPTPIETLEKAREIAVNEGLHYVTIGNVPGHKYNSTFCHKCGKCIIKRTHFQVLEDNVVDGKCKFCGQKIPGIWR